MNNNRIKKIISSSWITRRRKYSAAVDIIDVSTDEPVDFWETLKSESWAVRLDAVRSFRARRQVSDANISALVSLMNNHFEKPVIRVAAAEILGLKGYGAEYAFPFLSKMVKDDEIWPEAIQSLRTIGVANASVVSALIGALSDPSKRGEAAAALGAYGTSAKVAVPALKAVLTYSGPHTREIVEDAIRKIKGGTSRRASRSNVEATYR